MTIASSPHWALISDKGATVAPFDSMLSIDVKNENKLLTSPVEESGFASYNKVASPLDIYVELAASASESGHAALLAALGPMMNEYGVDFLYRSLRQTKNTASSTSKAIRRSARRWKGQRCLSRNCTCSKSGRSKYEYRKLRYEAPNGLRRRRKLIPDRSKRMMRRRMI